jgi:hypothetical protein
LQIFLCFFQSAFWHSFEQYLTLRHPEQRKRFVATVKHCAHLVSPMLVGVGDELLLSPHSHRRIRPLSSRKL